MSTTLLILAASGRIARQKPAAAPSGHILTINFSTGNSDTQCSTIYTSTSGQIFTSDTRGNITNFLLQQNRFSQHIKNIGPVSRILLINEDTLFLTKFKEILIYHINGKKLAELKQHYSSIIGVDYNYQKQYVLTFSAEIAVIWEVGSWKVVRNMRAKGNSFRNVAFFPNGNSVLTGFDDGKIYLWRLSDNKLMSQFAFSDVDRFIVDDSGQWVYGSGKAGEIFVWNMNDTSRIEFIISTIPGTTRILQMDYNKEGLWVLCNNGRLYFVNISEFRVEYEIQIGISYITYFHIQAGILTFVTNKGLGYVYDLNVMHSFNLTMNEEKLNKGLEEQLIFTYLKVLQPEGREEFEEGESMQPLESTEDIVFTKLNRANTTPSSSFPNVSKSASARCQHDLFKSLFSIAKLKPHETNINHCSMKKILQVKGEYPENLRALIWRFLVQLPNNVDSFAGLYSRGTHPEMVNLFRSMKKKGQNEFSRTERVTSALCYWSSLLSQVDYLPEIVGCFVKVFPGDDLSVFETVMSLILHWMQHWFEFFPNPPVVLIESIENIIRFHNPELFFHLSSMNFTEIIWDLLKSFLACAVAEADWLKIMDFLFTEWQIPEILLYLISGFILTQKNLLKKLTSQSELSKFFNTLRKIDAKKLSAYAENLRLNAGAAVVSFNIYLPICTGQYPLFTAYPQYKVQTKEELAQEILEQMRVKDEIRSYNIGLKSKVDDIESRQKEIVNRMKSLGGYNDDVIEAYHKEIVVKRMNLTSVNK